MSKIQKLINDIKKLDYNHKNEKYKNICFRIWFLTDYSAIIRCARKFERNIRPTLWGPEIRDSATPKEFFRFRFREEMINSAPDYFHLAARVFLSDKRNNYGTGRINYNYFAWYGDPSTICTSTSLNKAKIISWLTWKMKINV